MPKFVKEGFLWENFINPAKTTNQKEPSGGNVQGGREVKIDPGDRLPPTSQKGNKWTKK